MILKKNYYIIISFVFITIALGLALLSDKIDAVKSSSVKQSGALEKLYVALEEDGAVAVVETKNNYLLGNIDLTQTVSGRKVKYSAHNVQVAPDGKTVWVTANYVGEVGHEEEGVDDKDDTNVTKLPDQVIVIDPQTDVIIKRIDVGQDQHLAHVVVTQDGKQAFITAQETGIVYQINAQTFVLDSQIAFEKEAQPHGLRLAADDSFAYVALIGAQGIGIIDAQTGEFAQVPLSGSVVQTAIIPNTSLVAASVYDTREIALYDTLNQQVTYVQLPAGAEGPIQLYASPDGQYLYVADQGYYFGKPTSDYIYKIDIAQKRVVSTIQAGVAPHGAVVSGDGKRAYITNLLSGTVSVIDTTTDMELTKISVGAMPNGISLWTHQFGGTP